MRCDTVNTLGPHGAQVPAEILEKSWRNPRDKTSHGLIYRRASPILLPPVNDRYSRPKFLRFSVTLFLGEFCYEGGMGGDDGTSCRFGSAEREPDKSLTYNVLLTLVSSIVLCWSFWDLCVAKDTIIFWKCRRKFFMTIFGICITILIINLYFYIIEKCSMYYDLYFLAATMFELSILIL